MLVRKLHILTRWEELVVLGTTSQRLFFLPEAKLWCRLLFIGLLVMQAHPLSQLPIAFGAIISFPFLVQNAVPDCLVSWCVLFNRCQFTEGILMELSVMLVIQLFCGHWWPLWRHHLVLLILVCFDRVLHLFSADGLVEVLEAVQICRRQVHIMLVFQLVCLRLANKPRPVQELPGVIALDGCVIIAALCCAKVTHY